MNEHATFSKLHEDIPNKLHACKLPASEGEGGGLSIEGFLSCICRVLCCAGHAAGNLVWSFAVSKYLLPSLRSVP